MRMLQAILIPCSGRKREGGTPDYDGSRSVARLLSPGSAAKLLAARSELAQMLGLGDGPDVGGVVDRRLQYLPAFERYDGNLHRRAYLTPRDAQERPDKRIIIVSALYGLLLAGESIRSYELAMGMPHSCGFR